MGILTTGRVEASHRTFQRAIETASDLQTIFNQIHSRMKQQLLKSSRRTAKNRIAHRTFHGHISSIDKHACLCNAYYS